MGITQVNVLVLLSEEVIIFESFNTIRCKRMDFRIKDIRVDYMVRCIWLALQVHVQMDEFVRDGLKYNSAILAAFVCFLTTQMGKKGDLDTSDLKARLKNAKASVNSLRPIMVRAGTKTLSFFVFLRRNQYDNFRCWRFSLVLFFSCYR